MKIRMLSILASPKYGAASPGKVLHVDEQDGRDLIAGHYAVAVEETGSVRESAALSGGEQAVQKAAPPRIRGKVE